MLEVVLRGDELGLGRRERGARGVAERLRVVRLVLRDGAPLDKRHVARVGQLGVRRLGPAFRDLRLRVLDGRLVLHAVDAVEDVALLHLRAVREAHLEYLARDLRHDVNLRDGNDPSRIDSRFALRALRYFAHGQRNARRGKCAADDCNKHNMFHRLCLSHISASSLELVEAKALDTAFTRCGENALEPFGLHVDVLCVVMYAV